MNCTCWTYWRPGMAVSYPLSEWQDAVRYLTGDERDFASVKEIKAFIKQDMEA